MTKKHIFNKIYEFSIKALDKTKEDHNQKVLDMTRKYYNVLLILYGVIFLIYLFTGYKFFYDLLS